MKLGSYNSSDRSISLTNNDHSDIKVGTRETCHSSQFVGTIWQTAVTEAYTNGIRRYIRLSWPIGEVKDWIVYGNV